MNNQAKPLIKTDPNKAVHEAMAAQRHVAEAILFLNQGKPDLAKASLEKTKETLGTIIGNGSTA